MIYKNAQIADVKNIVVAEFGNGTISLVNSKNNEGHKSILMKQIEKCEIGTEFETKGTSSNQFVPELALIFKSKPSFDVFYNFV